MSYRAFLGVLTVLPFLVLAVLYTAGSLEAAGQGQTPPNSPPDFGKTETMRSVAENAAAGDFGDPITATDADNNDTLHYRITTRPRGPFAIDSGTGQLRTTEPLNYEAMSIHQTPSYMLTYYYLDIGVSDGSADDYISVEVKVDDLEEEGVVDLLWDQPQVGTPIVASVSDPDGEVSDITWQWAGSTDNSAWTDITTNGSATYTPVAGDEDDYLRATASYTDRYRLENEEKELGKATASKISANTTRLDPGSSNTAPIFTNTTATRSVRENTPAGAHLGDAFQAGDTVDGDEIRYFLGGTDDDGAFDLDPKTGQLKVKDPLNHESEDDTYSLSVFARDPTRAGDTSLPTGTVTVTITVTDINERPKVSGDFDPEYQENSATLLVTTLTGVDEDEKYGPYHQNTSVGWLIDGLGDSDGDFFYMDDDGDDGHLKFLVPPDFENPADQNRDNVYDISITAYTGRNDMTFFNVSVTVTDRDDEGILTGPSSVNYPERAETPVATYTLSDTTQQTISWSVAGTDRGQFTIDAGVLRFESPPDYDSPSDHDKNNKYSITVTAHGTNVTASMNVVVTVTEHNVPPQISGPASPIFAENATGTVATYSATDEDEDPITWSLAGVDAGDLSIHSSDGTLTFKLSPDFEHPADDDTSNDYDVTVQAYDGTVTVDYPVTVTVTNVNEAPSFDPQTATRTVDENTAADQPIDAPVVATDFDAGDTTLTYSLDSASTAVFAIDSKGQLTTKAALDHETTPSYSVTVTARDSRGLTGSIDVTINVGDVNEAPKFPAGTATRAVAENTATDQDFGDPVEATDQDDGDSVTYSLEGTDAASFDIGSGSGQLKTVVALNHKDKDSYSVTVVATDTASAADRIDVTITVTDVNEAPAFPATETGTRSIPENTATGRNIGDAVAAEDPDDGDTLTYSLGGTDAGSFDFDTSTGQIKTKDALDFEMKASYEVAVSVRDSRDGSGSPDTAVDATKDVTITVADSNEDIVLSGDTSPNYPENGTGDVATYSATDGDGGTIDWGLSGDDDSLFHIEGGVLTFDSPPDFEDAKDGGEDNHYQVTIEASTAPDDAAKLPVTITVTDVNEPPAFPGTETRRRSIAENTVAGGPIGTPVAADDPDAGATLTYTLGGTDAGSFSIVVLSGQLQVKDALDFETKPSHEVTVSVRDSKDDSGNTDTDDDATITVTITVTDANDAPTFNSRLTTTLAVDENTVAGTDIGDAFTATDQDSDPLTYSLDATSSAVFNIDTNGQLKTKGPLDHESTSSYTVTVSVSDSRNAEGTTDTAVDASIPVTVNVINLTEDGTITLSSRQPQVATAFTATLSDPNIASPVVTWAWEKSTDQNTWTTIASGTGAAYTPVDDDVGSYLQVTATYDGQQESDNKSAQAVSEFQVRVAPTGANTAPAFADDAVTRQVREGIAVGANVGSPVTATDTDTDDSDKLTYTLSGDDADSFDIDAATGQIKTAITLDHDTDNSYTVIVTATDPSLESDTITVTIAVTQAPPRQSNSGNSGNGGGGGGSPTQRTNSKPGFEEGHSTTREVAENTPAGRNIGQSVTATDDDNDTLTYSLSGTHAASFGINTSTGQLKTNAPLDYETKNSYSVTVTASDGMAGSTDATIALTITVTDMNEPPAFGPHTVTRAVNENTVADTSIGDAFTATDPDVGDALTYSLGGTDAAAFDIDASTGQLKTKAPLDYETKSSYAVTVSVRDNDDTLQDDSISVTITIINLNEVATLTLSSLQPQVGTPFTATLNDPDGASNETWAWEKSSGRTNWTTISNATSPSYTPVAGDVNYYLRVTAFYTDSNSSNKSAQALSEFAVRAEPSETNTGPDFGAETADRSIVEGSAAGRNIGQPVTATDANTADEGKLTYTLSGTDGGSFDIVASSGQLLTKGPLVHATQSSYTVTVTATDPFRASDTIAVTINVTANVPPRQQRSSSGDRGDRGGGAPPKPTKPEPEFDANGPVTITVPENTEAGTAIGDPLTATDDDDMVLTYSIINWRDGSSFDIDSSTGQLKTKGPLDYETRTQYELQANVHDDDGGDDWISINIRVTDVAEAPTVTGDTTIQVAENSGGNLATYTATDPEGLDVTWGLSGDDAGDFSIANGALRFQSTPDHENPADSDGNNVYNVTVEASDGTDTGSLDVTVTVTNLVDDFRVRTSTRGSDTKGGSGGSGLGIEMTSMSYPENSTATVATYAAVEPSGNTITWSAAGDDGSLFSMTGGALSFNSSPDYESPADSDGNNSYVVKVQASDGTETASLDITINVTNVNEAPSVTGETAFDYAEQSTGSVAAYTASDPEGDELTWSLSGDDSDAFSIAAGVLSFANKPNYEEPSDSGTDNIYVITVQASDGAYIASLDVSVTVTDIQEVPITNAATQAVGKVRPDSKTTITTPDGVASITFPEESRENSYMVRVDSDPNNCAEDDEEDSADGSFDGTAQDSDDELRVCLTVHIFDNWGNQEENVTLDQPASISFKMDADELGSVEEVLQAYENDGFSIHAQNGENDEWTMVEFVLEADDQGVVTMTASGVSSLGSFAATTNAVVFRQLTATPTPTPAPPPSLGPSGQRSTPASMVAPMGASRPAPPASSSAGAPTPSQTPKQPASLSPTFQEFVSDPPLWALILMIVGAVMALTGGGVIAVPPWMRRRLSVIR